MRISFEMSGGYGGLFAKQPLFCEIDTDKLGELKKREILDIVLSSGILDLSPEEGGTTLRPDVFIYRLTVTQDGDARQFAFDDITAPAAVRPLLQYFQTHAMKVRMEGG